MIGFPEGYKVSIISIVYGFGRAMITEHYSKYQSHVTLYQFYLIYQITLKIIIEFITWGKTLELSKDMIQFGCFHNTNNNTFHILLFNVELVVHSIVCKTTVINNISILKRF